MEPDKTRAPKPQERRYLKGTFILVGCCVAAAILGIFVGIIVIYGGSQALQPNGIG